MDAARSYWNTCQVSIASQIERKLLKEPLKVLLKCLADVSKYSDFEEVCQNSFYKCNKIPFTNVTKFLLQM